MKNNYGRQPLQEINFIDEKIFKLEKELLNEDLNLTNFLKLIKSLNSLYSLKENILKSRGLINFML